MGPPAQIAFAALLAGSAFYAGYEKKQAGLAAKYEYQAKAQQEKLAARDREIRRRQELLRSLAASSAKFSAQGTEFTGSPAALLVNDFNQYELDNTTAAAQTAATQNYLSMAGRNAAYIGRVGYIGGILQAGTAAMGALGGVGGKVNTPSTYHTHPGP